MRRQLARAAIFKQWSPALTRRMERQGEFTKFAVSDNDYLPRYAREGDGSNIHKLK